MRYVIIPFLAIFYIWYVTSSIRDFRKIPGIIWVMTYWWEFIPIFGGIIYLCIKYW